MRRQDNRYWLEVALAYTLMLLLLILGSSCSTKRNVEKTRIDTSSVKKVERDDITFDSVSNSWIFQWDTISLNRLWTITIYDTDKTDSLGQHPIKAVIEGCDDIKYHGETETINGDSTNIQIQHDNNLEKHNDIEETENSETKVKPSFAANIGGFICFALVILSIGVCLKTIVKKVI